MIDAAGMRVMKAIADEGSFTAAAVSLGYSQPAISQMVRRLEERTGTALVERLGRTVRLTEAGAVLARHAGPVLSALEAAESEVASIAGLRAGRIRLMSFPSASSTVVPKALALVKRRYPDIEVTFAEAEPPESIAELRAGSCDLAVAFMYEGVRDGHSAEDLEGLTTTTLLEDSVRLAVPSSHPVAGADSVSMAELADAEWIAGCPRCRGHLVELAAEAGFVPRVAFETEDYVTVQSLVAEGLGVSLIPDLIAHSTRLDGVATVELAPASRRRVVAVSTPDLERVPAVSATLQALGEAANQLQSSPAYAQACGRSSA